MAAPPITPIPNGVISTQPNVGDSAFTVTMRDSCRSRASGSRGVLFRNTHATVIRAGFGMYNDLQDALGYRTDQNAPFNPTYSLPNAAAVAASAQPGAQFHQRRNWFRAECSPICRRRR